MTALPPPKIETDYRWLGLEVGGIYGIAAMVGFYFNDIFPLLGLMFPVTGFLAGYILDQHPAD